jgi:hypothetical protein
VDQPVSLIGSVAETILANCFSAELPFTEILASVRGERPIDQTGMELLLRPPYQVKQKRAATGFSGWSLPRQSDTSPTSQKFEGLGKRNALEVLNKTQDVAELVARPTAEALASRIDVEGGSAVFVEGAESFECAAGRTESDVGPNDIDDIVGLFDLLDQG